MNEVPKELSFSITARTIRLLGRENISSPVIAILELVKNSYDADASTVKVTLSKASTSKGTITIRDDGDGMNINELRENWMIIGTDSKEREPFTKQNRLKVGEKGIGRLALDRLSELTVIETCIADAAQELRLTIDWNKYEGANLKLHEVYHPLEVIKSRKCRRGTTLLIKRLRDNWSKNDVERLYSDLSLLLSPFNKEPADFTIEFESDEFPEFNGPISSIMATMAEYTLVSDLTSEGKIHHKLTHRSGEVSEDIRQWKDAFNDELAAHGATCGPLHLELFFYLRGATRLGGTDIKRAEMNRFLDCYQGVRIYRDMMRVKPYGDPRDDKDWLGLNARKAGSPEAVTGRLGSYRVWGNQTVGGLSISRVTNPDLCDQTNREGLFENRAYWDMRRFILHGIRFLEYERQIHAKREKKKRDITEPKPIFQKVVSEVEDEIKNSTSVIQEVIRNSALQSPTEVKALQILQHTIPLVGRLRKAHEEEIAELINENQMLTGLATLGIALVVFGHETSQIITALSMRTKLIASIIPTVPVKYRPELERDIHALEGAIERVESWGQFALNHVKRDKRTARELRINDICESVLSAFSGLFQGRSIKVDKNFDLNLPSFRGFAMDIEGILINLITNSVEALRPIKLEQRRISVSTEFDELSAQIILTFTDSGKGILEQDISRIYNPLFTTRVDKDGQPTGTGMGLTIIKSILEQCRGSVEVRGHGDLNGAVFTIYLPLK